MRAFLLRVPSSPLSMGDGATRHHFKIRTQEKIKKWEIPQALLSVYLSWEFGFSHLHNGLYQVWHKQSLWQKHHREGVGNTTGEGEGETCFSFQVKIKRGYLQFFGVLFSVQVSEKHFVTSQLNSNIAAYKPSGSGMETHFIEAQRPPTLLLGEVAICC